MLGQRLSAASTPITFQNRRFARYVRTGMYQARREARRLVFWRTCC